MSCSEVRGSLGPGACVCAGATTPAIFSPALESPLGALNWRYTHAVPSAVVTRVALRRNWRLEKYAFSSVISLPLMSSGRLMSIA